MVFLLRRTCCRNDRFVVTHLPWTEHADFPPRILGSTVVAVAERLLIAVLDRRFHDCQADSHQCRRPPEGLTKG